MQRTGPATRVATDPAAIWAAPAGSSPGGWPLCRPPASAGAGSIDPGLGYFLGSNPEPSLTALAGIRELKARFGVPVLVCPSRKSFLRTLTRKDAAHAGPATLAAEIFAAWQGADYIRTHDVAALCDALTVFGAIASQSLKSLPYRGEPDQPPGVAAPCQ